MICGEGEATLSELLVTLTNGGDPASVHFFHEVGLDYVSCSPFRVPVARVAAGGCAIDVDARFAVYWEHVS